jgi:signal peptidase II
VERARWRAPALLFLTAGCVYLADRLTKLWAAHSLRERPIDLIHDVLTLQYTTNSGGAFSLGQGAPWLFAGVTIVVVCLIVGVGFRRRSALSAVALGLVLGGALGNLTDRVMRGPGLSGRVVDFVDLHVWPVFNVADASIVVGALLLAWVAVRSDRTEGRTAPQGEAADGPVDGH